MKAKLITKQENGHIGGPYSIMQHAATVMKSLGLEPGRMHSIHRIDFDDEKMFRAPDGTKQFQDCTLFMIIILCQGGGDVRLSYVDINCGSMPLFHIDGDETITAPCYDKSQFLKVPDDNELIAFMKCIERPEYSRKESSLLYPIAADRKIEEALIGESEETKRLVREKTELLQANVHRIETINDTKVFDVMIDGKDLRYNRHHNPKALNGDQKYYYPIKYAKITLRPEASPNEEADPEPNRRE